MGKPGLIEIHVKEDSFIFVAESTGAIKASQLVLNAVEALKQKLDAVPCERRRHCGSRRSVWRVGGTYDGGKTSLAS
ncbi:dna-directed rna polymerases ii, iv and v subunit 3 [Nicotiana attenuata]|uniref:Dna-directed rna polymerases ii, iv and v subunit 3 n=1 Tax=Nicotiana attenuata TaxID=49451 RepID=A0A1J6HV01_NICAT|nr:dna-directed rna polymerases ii, iv and v subunit 3 [Nicotiana attenuata]